MNTKYKDLTNLKVANPCPASWDAMAGDDHQRFCGQCEKHVTDISTFTRREASEFLTDQSGCRVCVKYRADRKGRPMFRRAGWVAALAAVMISAIGCGGSSGRQNPVVEKLSGVWDRITGRQPTVIGEMPAMPPPSTSKHP